MTQPTYLSSSAVSRNVNSYLLSSLVLLALVVVFLGAYTRIKDAGLGCPDWPGCYGQWRVPSVSAETLALYPDTPLHPEKAWLEMIHRYVAGSLGLGIFLWTLFKGRYAIPSFKRKIAYALCILVLFQAALGMWTVTLKLWPIVVMGHLLGGLLILSLCWLLFLLESNGLKQGSNSLSSTPLSRAQLPSFSLLRRTLFFALGLLILQILLGGWTSANYAALSCPDFPLCGDLSNAPWRLEAFAFWKGGDLENPLAAMTHLDRMTIQMAHRLGALILGGSVLTLSYLLWKTKAQKFRIFALALMSLMGIQITLGWANVAFWLPWTLALSHHIVAVFLLLTFISLVVTLHAQQLQSYSSMA